MNLQLQRIALIDPDERRRAGIVHALLGAVPHVEPYDGAGEFAGVPHNTDLLLVYDDGASFARIMSRLDETHAALPVAAYGDAPDIRQVVDAMRAGAFDYLTLPITPDHVTDLAESYTTAFQSASLLRVRVNAARRKIAALSRREREVLSHLVNGLTSKEIADQLMISPRTVEIHRNSVLKRLGCDHVYVAIRIAGEAQLAT